MGQSQYFHDRALEPQDLGHRHFSVQRDDMDYRWHLDFQGMSNESAGTIHLPETHGMSNMQRFLHCHEQRSYFNDVPAWSRAPIDTKHHTFHGVEMQTPWSHKPMAPNAPSPFSSQGDHRSSIDQDSLSSGSVWSPRTNETYLEYDTVPVPRVHSPCDGIGYSTDHNIYPPCMLHSPGGLRGIVPSEVQLYPDAETEAPVEQRQLPNDPRFQDGAMNAPYCAAAAAAAQHDVKTEHIVPEDEGIGSSINDGSVESHFSEDDDIEMEDNRDEDTDYKPSKPTKSTSTRRTPRVSAGNKSPIMPKRVFNKITKSASRSSSSSIKKCSHSDPMVPNQNVSERQPQSSGNTKNLCNRCPQSYHSPSALNKHIQSTHTRPFSCTFARYGCPSTFGSKNEWKRHVTSQHLRLGVWRCDIGACVPQGQPSSTRRSHGRKPSLSSEDDQGGWNEFNRKDLFTQHVRRMHGPPAAASKAEKEAFEMSLEGVRNRCWMSLHPAPPKSLCGFCLRKQPRQQDGSPPAQLGGEEEKKLPVFEGKQAWEDRMEHVGRHLEKQPMKEEDEDVELREWMVQEGLLFREGGVWRVVGIAEGKKHGGAGV